MSQVHSLHALIPTKCEQTNTKLSLSVSKIYKITHPKHLEDQKYLNCANMSKI